jgi:CHAD domain-containing protein
MSDAEELPKTLRKLVARYARKLLENYQNLDFGEREAAHDLRVTTRRLQAILDLISSGKTKGKLRKLRSRLKRLRHVIGEARDLEITLDRAQQCSRRTVSSSRRELWEQIENDTHRELDRAAAQARRSLRQIPAHRLQRQLKHAVRKRLKSIDAEQFVEAAAKAQDKLSAALRTALKSKESRHYHNVRIKAKSLRYTLELLAQLYSHERHVQLIELLKSVQDELGAWHDETELCRRATAILSKTPDLQADEIATALLDSLRDQTRRANDHARDVIVSLAGRLSSKREGSDSGPNERKQS